MSSAACMMPRRPREISRPNPAVRLEAEAVEQRRSVKPWMTSVPSTTQKAERTIRSRPGNPGGNANAVASVTSPRMPHQETSTPPATVGGAVPGVSATPNERFIRRASVL